MQKLLLTCHSQDPHNHINTAVSQQGHFQSRGCTFLLFPFGFERCPDTGSEDQQVEQRYCNHTWYVHSHDWLASSVLRDNTFVRPDVAITYLFNQQGPQQLFILSNHLELPQNQAWTIMTPKEVFPVEHMSRGSSGPSLVCWRCFNSFPRGFFHCKWTSGNPRCIYTGLVYWMLLLLVVWVVGGNLHDLFHIYHGSGLLNLNHKKSFTFCVSLTPVVQL